MVVVAAAAVVELLPMLHLAAAAADMVKVQFPA
jgi:hypothetical protein